MTEKDLPPNLDIVLFALYNLGGASKKIHTEYIADEAYKLAPERFSWRLPEFKNRPDKTPVRHALEQAKKKEHGHLVTGRAGGDVRRAGGGAREGWQLTREGVVWVQKSIEKISKVLKKDTPKIPREINQIVKKFRNDPAFKRFLIDKNLQKVTPYMFTDMLICSPDASKEVINSKFKRFLSVAEQVQDKKMIHFLEACQEKFSNLLSDEFNKE